MSKQFAGKNIVVIGAAGGTVSAGGVCREGGDNRRYDGAERGVFLGWRIYFRKRNCDKDAWFAESL